MTVRKNIEVYWLALGLHQLMKLHLAFISSLLYEASSMSA